MRIILLLSQLGITISFPPRYDSEGRLTNVTYPTGMVTSLHREIERSINIDIESSSRDGDITVITNLSSVEASYTVVQGKASPSAFSTSVVF